MTKRHQRVSLESLRLLDAIERQGSFAAAAQELCVVTSSITHTIHNLEENLGLVLFDRSGRRARFTTKGRALLESGRHLLARADAFDDQVRLLATGWEASLTISVDQLMRVSPLMPLVQAFFAVAPTTALHIRREAAAGSWDALQSGRADLVIGAPAGGAPGAGFEAVVLFEDPFVLAVAPGHPLASRRDRIGNAEMQLQRSVVVGDTTRSLPNLPYSLQDNRSCLSVPDQAAKLEAILSGIGCGFVPRRVAEPLVRQGRLVLLESEAVHPTGSSSIAWRAGEDGRALRWWIAQLTRPGQAETLFS